MGGGSYSSVHYMSMSNERGYDKKSAREIFTADHINNAMNPYGVKIRESRDSDEHPESLAIIIALDVTGSMGSVPHHLVKEGLPHAMDGIMKAGIEHPQVLFLGIGDHVWDSSPLQVGQFESSDELLMKWLTDVYLEGGGGGNDGESYLLAWYFAGYHTSIDCFEKRKKKGFLFTIGDEPNLQNVDKAKMEEIMGEGQQQPYSAAELLEKAKEMYDVYHIIIRETYSGSRQSVVDGWKQLMGDHAVEVQSHAQVAEIIAEIVAKNAKNTDTSETSKTEEIL